MMRSMNAIKILYNDILQSYRLCRGGYRVAGIKILKSKQSMKNISIQN